MHFLQIQYIYIVECLVYKTIEFSCHYGNSNELLQFIDLKCAKYLFVVFFYLLFWLIFLQLKFLVLKLRAQYDEITRAL